MMIHNRFEVTEILGAGGEASVSLVRDLARGGATVALKDLTRAGKAELKRIRHEFRLLADLRHPNLARVLEHGSSESGEAFMVYEYVPGAAVTELEPRPDPESFAELVAQALRGLGFLHTKNIVHGDISPPNLRVTPDGRLKIIDFGMRAPIGTLPPGGGTPPFLAPERLRGGALNPETDLFSLGAVAYRVLGDRNPFPIGEGGSIRYDDLVPLDELRPDLPEPLVRWVHKMLALEPEQRPASARSALTALAEAADRALPLETPATLEAHLESAAIVGNTSEQGELRRIFHQLVDPNERGTIGVVLVQGEKGTGKSRMLEDFRNWVEVNGGRALEVAGYSDHAPPYAAVLNLLQRIHYHGWPTDLTPLRNAERLIGTLGDGDENESLAREKTQARALSIYGLVASPLFDLARRAPLVLLIDDLHRVDASSTSFLTYLIRNMGLEQRDVSDVTPQLMLVASIELGGERSPALDQLVKETAEINGHALAVNPLGPREIEQLITEFLGGQSPDASAVDWAHRLTKGNPLFLHELFSALKDRLVPFPDRPGLELRLRDEDRGTVPATLAGLVQSRLDPLADESRRVLTFVSLFLTPVRIEVLARGLGLEPATCRSTLDELVKRRFLFTLEDDPDRYGLRDDAVREILARTISEDERRELHGRAGRALESERAATDEYDLPELAHHFIIADPRDRGYRYAEQAARWAKSLHAYPTAIDLFQSALESVPATAVEDRDRLRASLAATYLATGQGQAAIDLLTPALEETTGSRARLLRDLGKAHAAVGNFAEAFRCHRDSARALEDRSPLARIPGLLQWAQAAARLGRTTAAVRLGRFALEWERTVDRDDPKTGPVLLEMHRVLGQLCFQRGEFQEAKLHTDRWLPLVQNAPLEQAAALNQLGNIDLRLGDADKAARLYEQAMSLREKHGDLQGMAATLNNLGILERRRGDHATAAECFRGAVKIQARLGNRAGQATTLSNLAHLYFDDAKMDRAVDTYERCLRLAQQLGDRQVQAGIHANLAGIKAMQGDYGDAIEHFMISLRARRRLRTPGRMEEMLISIGSMLTEIGDLARARRILGRIRKRTHDTSPELEADAGFELGRIALIERRFDEARQAFEWTVERSRSLGYPLLGANALLALTNLYLLRGDIEAARQCFEQGLETIGRIRCHEDLRVHYSLTRIELDQRTRAHPPEVLARDLEQLLSLAEVRNARPCILDVIWPLARIREQQDDPAGALDLYQRATDLIERMTATIPSRRICDAFLGSNRVRRLEQAVSAFRHRLYLKSPDPTVRDEQHLNHLKSDLYDVERYLDFTKSRFDKQNAGLKRILEIAHVMSAAIQTDGLFELILDSILELTDAERGFVIIRDDSSEDELRVMAARDCRKNDIAQPEREISYSVVSRVLDEGRPMMLRDAAGDDIIDHTQSVLRLDLRSIMCVPLVAGQETTGVLYLENRSRADRFAEDDLELLSIFAHQASIALTNAELFRDLSQSLIDLREAQARLIRQEKLRLMGEMASGVLHNLKNLLTPVLGHTQILLLDPDNAHLGEDLRAIERLTLDCREVIQRLGNFSRGGDKPLEVAPVAIRALVSDVVSMTRTRWEKPEDGRRAAIRMVNDVTEDTMAMVNAAQIREVFVNLVYNAVDAMPDGGEIRFSACTTEEEVTITVADTGLGMTEEVLKKMFEPFFSTKKQKGMGVGMSVTDLIVQQHGGHITVDSKPGEGTRIHIHLSRRAAPGTRTAPRDDHIRAPRTVLVVDDDRDVRRFVGEAMRAQGYEVFEVPAGEEVEPLLRRLKSSPDLVFSDLRMPGISGVEVAEIVKRHDARVPVVIMTAWPQEVPDSSCVDAVLGKPVTLDELANTAERFTTGVGVTGGQVAVRGK